MIVKYKDFVLKIIWCLLKLVEMQTFKVNIYFISYLYIILFIYKRMCTYVCISQKCRFDLILAYIEIIWII